MAGQVQFEHVVINFVSILVEAAKSVNVVVAAICYGSVDQTSWTLAHGPRDLWPIAILPQPRIDRGIGHDVGVVGGGSRGGR